VRSTARGATGLESGFENQSVEPARDDGLIPGSHAAVLAGSFLLTMHPRALRFVAEQSVLATQCGHERETLTGKSPFCRSQISKPRFRDPITPGGRSGPKYQELGQLCQLHFSKDFLPFPSAWSTISFEKSERRARHELIGFQARTATNRSPKSLAVMGFAYSGMIRKRATATPPRDCVAEWPGHSSRIWRFPGRGWPGSSVSDAPGVLSPRLWGIADARPQPPDSRPIRKNPRIERCTRSGPAFGCSAGKPVRINEGEAGI